MIKYIDSIPNGLQTTIVQMTHTARPAGSTPSNAANYSDEEVGVTTSTLLKPNAHREFKGGDNSSEINFSSAFSYE